MLHSRAGRDYFGAGGGNQINQAVLTFGGARARKRALVMAPSGAAPAMEAGLSAEFGAQSAELPKRTLIFDILNLMRRSAVVPIRHGSMADWGVRGGRAAFVMPHAGRLQGAPNHST
jgi:hypothetical protein